MLTVSPARSLLLLYLPVAFGLMLTVFSPKQFLKKYDDLKSYVLYFSLFCLCLCLVPAVILIVQNVKLLDVGLTLGNRTTGVRVLLIGMPLAVLSAFVGSRDPQMKSQYPFSKLACRNAKTFVLYEVAYLVLYYFPWEFIFRGVFLFFLLAHTDVVAAIAIQTMVSTVYHIGHPSSEILGAAFAGFIFGAIAVITGSFLYPFVIHAVLGICDDTFLYFRYHREKAETP